jgi:outer membrane protein TolC
LRDVARAWREFEAATRNLATAAAIQADAREQLRLVTLRQTAGKAIEAEVLDALSVAANARETVVRSIARYDIAIAAIHHAAGDLSP